MKLFLIVLVRVYKLLLSPIFSLLGARCRFHPTCSTYALEALEIYPWWKAIFMIGLRIIKCNPLCEGGVDLARANKGNGI